MEAVEECFCHIPVMEEKVDEYLAQKMEQVPEDANYELQFPYNPTCCFRMRMPSWNHLMPKYWTFLT